MAKVYTIEELKAREEKKAAKKAAREARWEKFKDGFCEVGGAMLPIILPVAGMMGISIAAAVSDSKKSKKIEAEKNEYADLLAIGKGFNGRKDPKYIAYCYDMEHPQVKEDIEDVEYEEVDS